MSTSQTSETPTDIFLREQKEFDPVFRPLFTKAKETKEFEYACTLLRVRGLESAGWDSFQESRQLLMDIVGLTNAPLQAGTRFRLGLLMYVHVIEMNAPYHIVYNLLRVINGERYSIVPFRDPQTKHEEIYFSGKIKKIDALSKQVGMPQIGGYFTSFVSRQIRNAFAHSQYTLHEDRFNITDGEGVEIDHVIDPSVPITSYVAPRIERAINFVFLFIDLLAESIGDYKEPKIVKGDMQGPGSNIDIELTVEAGYDLTGFRTPPKTHPTT